AGGRGRGSRPGIEARTEGLRAHQVPVRSRQACNGRSDGECKQGEGAGRVTLRAANCAPSNRERQSWVKRLLMGEAVLIARAGLGKAGPTRFKAPAKGPE